MKSSRDVLVKRASHGHEEVKGCPDFIIPKGTVFQDVGPSKVRGRIWKFTILQAQVVPGWPLSREVYVRMLP